MYKSKRTDGFRRHWKYRFARTVKRIRTEVDALQHIAAYANYVKQLKEWLNMPEVIHFIKKYNLKD